MLKVGDAVALKNNPTVPVGKITKKYHSGVLKCQLDGGDYHNIYEDTGCGWRTHTDAEQHRSPIFVKYEVTAERKKFWMVVHEGKSFYLHKYKSKSDAIARAEGDAVIHPGSKIYVMEAVESYSTEAPVVTKTTLE